MSTAMDWSNPARAYALIAGAALALGGVLGFFYNASFAVGPDVPRDAVLGLLDVNGWHNVVHLATGLLGLVAARSVPAARAYALGLGAVYLVVFMLGLVVGDGGTILNLIPINTEDNALHLLLAIAGIAAGVLASRSARAGAPRRA